MIDAKPIELGTYRGWRLWAYRDREQVRAYAAGPGRERDSEEALFVMAPTPAAALAALRRQIDLDLGTEPNP